MLEEYRNFRLKTAGGDTVEVEVNWSDNEKDKNCGLVRFKIADKDVEIDRKDLMALMILIGDSADQKKMLPMKMSTVRKMERLLTFEWLASRNYQKGEKITVKAPWIDTHTDAEEMISGALKLKSKYAR